MHLSTKPFIILFLLLFSVFAQEIHASDFENQRPSNVNDQQWKSLKSAIQETKILPQPSGIGGQLSHFGSSVAIKGNRALVGASEMDGAGLVFVMEYDGSIWLESAVLKPSDGVSFDRFGVSVSLLGDQVLIGAPGVDGEGGLNSGAAYIFDYDGNNWNQSQKISADDGGLLDGFGLSVSLTTDTALIGVSNDDDVASNSGAAFIFNFDGTNWIQGQKLIANDADSSDNFGHAVSISGSRALISSYRDEELGSGSGSSYLFEYDGSNWLQVQKLLASDGSDNDRFGYSVFLLDDQALIGAYGDDASTGSAYLFGFDGVSWVQNQKLMASDGNEDDQFGYSVSMSTEKIIIGAFMDDNSGENEGSAYVFDFDGSLWTQSQKLSASNAGDNDNFGNAVTISGDNILIGAFNNDDLSTASGSAYVFNIKNDDWNVNQIFTSEGGSSFKNLGISVSILGNRAIIGSTGENDYTGAVFVYEYNGKLWTQTHKLTASDAEEGDYFGNSASQYGDRVLISANRKNGSGTATGAAYIFDYDGNNWIQSQKITASDGMDFDYFGDSVSLKNNRALIGAAFTDFGSAYIFDFDGKTWTETQKLNPDDGDNGDRFGYSVSLFGDRALIGSNRNDGVANRSGSAYIFEFNGAIWNQTQKLNANDGAASDRFGLSVSLYADNALIGADRRDDTAESSGAAYMFTYDGKVWNQTQKLTPSDAAADDVFGKSVYLTENQALIGASFKANINGPNSGAAYLFTFDGTLWNQSSKVSDDNGKTVDFYGESVSLSGDKIIIGAPGVSDHGTSSGAAYIYNVLPEIVFLNSFESPTE